VEETVQVKEYGPLSMQCILKQQTTALFAGLGTPCTTDKGLNMVTVITTKCQINIAYYCLSTSTNAVWIHHVKRANSLTVMQKG